MNGAFRWCVDKRTEVVDTSCVVKRSAKSVPYVT